MRFSEERFAAVGKGGLLATRPCPSIPNQTIRYLCPKVRFSGCGERFAAIGEGGLLGAWRLDAPRRGGLGRADWAMQVESLALHFWVA